MLRSDQPSNEAPYGVLVVSQVPETTAALVDMLQTAGESVYTVEDTDNAWRYIRGGRVGLIILDLEDNPLDGLGLFRATRSFSDTADLPFLFMAPNEYEARNHAPAGEERIRDGWLKVPCNEQELTAMISRRLQHLAYSRLQARKPEPQVEIPKSESGRTTAALKAGIISGRLGTVSVPKVLSMIESMGLSGMLHITSDKQHSGYVHFVNGAVWHAKIGEIEGPDALFLLFHIHQGEFGFEEHGPPKARTIQSNMMSLLLEGLRKLDEAKAMLKNTQERRKSTTFTDVPVPVPSVPEPPAP